MILKCLTFSTINCRSLIDAVMMWWIQLVHDSSTKCFSWCSCVGKKKNKNLKNKIKITALLVGPRGKAGLRLISCSFAHGNWVFSECRGPSPLLTAGHLSSFTRRSRRAACANTWRHGTRRRGNVFVICSPSSASLPPSLLHISAHAIVLTRWVFARGPWLGGRGGGGVMLKESEPGPPRWESRDLWFYEYAQESIRRFNAACASWFPAKNVAETFWRSSCFNLAGRQLGSISFRRKSAGWIISDASFIIMFDSKVPLRGFFCFFWMGAGGVVVLISLSWPWFSSPLPSSFIFRAPCCFPLIRLPASFRSPSPRSKAIKQNQIPHVLLRASTCSARMWLTSLLHPRLYSSTGQRVTFDPPPRALPLPVWSAWWMALCLCSFWDFSLLSSFVSKSSFLLLIDFLPADSLSVCRCTHLFVR